MKKSLMGLSIVLLLLSGCGSSSSNVIKVALDIEDEGRYDALFADFKDLTGIEISATYGQDVGKLIGTKDEPDIIKTSTVSLDSMKSSLISLDPYISGDDGIDTGIYLDVIMDSLKSDGHVYALPTSVNTSLLYYNKDMFDESKDAIVSALGLQAGESYYPSRDWTYDDFQKAGVALSKYTESGGERTYTSFGCDNQLNWWGEWLVYVNQMGGSFYEEGSDNHRLAITSPEAVSATRFWREKAMGDANTKFSPNAVESASAFSFSNGNVAMIVGGHIGDWYSYDLLGLNWDIQILPTPVGLPNAKGGEISADAFGISKRSHHAEDAFRFLKLWAGHDGAVEMYRNGKIGALKDMKSIIASLPEEDQLDINIDALFEAESLAVALPREKDFSKVMEQMVVTSLYSLFLTGRSATSDVEGVLAKIKNNVDEYYEGLYGN